MGSMALPTRRGAVVKGLAAALELADDALEVVLDAREHALGVVVDVIAQVSLVLGGLVANLLGLLVGEADDLLVASEDHGLLLGVCHDGVCRLVSVGEDLFLLLHDAASGVELLGEDVANLVEEVVDGVGVNDLGITARAAP